MRATVWNEWQFSALCEFVTLFGEALRITEIDLLKFENELANESEDGPYLREVRLSLIKSLSSNRTINIENMDDFIRRQYTYRRVIPNPLLLVERVWKESFPDAVLDDDQESDNSDLGDVEEVEQQTVVNWLDLSIPQRVRVLHDLCEWQLQSDKFRERIGANTEMQMSQWRVLPVGQDSQNQLYYLLSDGRLYRCDHPAVHFGQTTTNKKRKRGKLQSMNNEQFRDHWTCIAANYDEWQSIVKDLDSDNSSQEEELLEYLVHTALPYVEEIENERLAKLARLKAKEEKIEADRIKEMLRQELLSTRKRSSRIATMDGKREAERLRHEEFLRVQELEKRAHQLAQQQERNVQVVPHKTREARARERELREFVLSQQNSPLPAGKSISGPECSDTPQSASNRPIETVLADSSSSSVEKSGPNLNVDTNQEKPVKINRADNGGVVHDHPATSPPRQQMVVAAEDTAWIDRQASHMTQGIPLNHELISDAVKTDAEPKEQSNGLDEASNQVLINSEDAAWVNRQADEMSRGVPFAHDHVSTTPQVHADDATFAGTRA
ncbi:putative PHD finger domain protein [Taphrina deformans PYCC 5710]|uniref:PHD finger domain protein n=1 Tax=Taphrina deformans (strain PYCC 5710 / ATCC 11124 / CBS 356.35 / IMI 108563 / JCM 9778 / NBRC 8474) TaxID=1097556 RepID=R4X9A2_TAPDE|nr:putative PHD finger domain protein [Taphrina deformans PYCC 5710]|eukprot:CCG82265.1 putative PHD finger domain protein [Taphrina deformans PYCC 5710]